MICGHWQDGAHCGAHTTRAYLTGPRCPAHTPAALAGRPETIPDPALTLNGLRAAKGIAYHFRATDTALNDARATASGRRRSNARDYRDAQAQTTRRRRR